MGKHGASVGRSLPDESEGLLASEDEEIEEEQSGEEPSEEDLSDEEPIGVEPSEEESSEEELSEEEMVEEDHREEPSEVPSGKFVSEPAFCNGNDNKHQSYLKQSNSGEKKTSAETMGGHSGRKNKLELPSRTDYESGPSSNYLEDKDKIKISKTISDQSTSKGQYNTGSSGRKRHSRWDKVPEGDGEALDGDVVTKRRKTRWDDDDAQLKMLVPLLVPDFSKGLVDAIDLDPEIQELNERLLELNRKLQAPEVVDDRSETERSPSPLPIYNGVGIRINTREVRLRAKLVHQRRKIITQLVRRNPNFKPPHYYKPLTRDLYRRIYLPVKQYPGYNFLGLIIGPRATTVKRMEKESGAKISLRGIGSFKEGMAPRGRNLPLHVQVRSDNQKSLDAAVEMVEKLLASLLQGVNEHKLSQQRELAELNTIDRKTASKIDAPCNICFDAGHPTYSCPLIVSAQGSKTDNQCASSIANLGDGGLSPFSGPPVPSNASMRFCPVMGTLPPYNSKSNKEIDDANVYVCHLPQSVNDDRLVELFSPFGTISQSKVVKDRATGISKGYGFVRYTDPICVAKAVKQMNRHRIDGNILAVRVADRPPIDASAISCSNAVHPTFSCFSTASTPGSKTDSKIDDVNLYVGYLPPSVNDDRLIELFSPFGTIRQSKLVKDKATGLSKGYGFVMYADPVSAAKAVEQMNGRWIDGMMLRVLVAGCPPITSSDISLLPTYPGHAALTQQQPGLMDWPCLPENDGTMVHNYFFPSHPASNGSPYTTPVDVSQPKEFTQFPGTLSNVGSQYFSFQRNTSSLDRTPISSFPVSTIVAQPVELAQFQGNLSNVASQSYSYQCETSSSLYRIPVSSSLISSNVTQSAELGQFPSNLSKRWLR